MQSSTPRNWIPCFFSLDPHAHSIAVAAAAETITQEAPRCGGWWPLASLPPSVLWIRTPIGGLAAAPASKSQYSVDWVDNWIAAASSRSLLDIADNTTCRVLPFSGQSRGPCKPRLCATFASIYCSFRQSALSLSIFLFLFRPPEALFDYCI